MPRRIWLPSACTMIVSLTVRSPSAATSTTASKRSITSAASTGAPMARTRADSNARQRRRRRAGGWPAIRAGVCHIPVGPLALEGNLGHGATRVVGLEERALGEAEHAGDQVAREGLHHD